MRSLHEGNFWRLGAFPALGWSCALTLCVAGCDRGGSGSGSGNAGSTNPPRPSQIVFFPDSLQVADQTVNTFVAEALRVSVADDYEPFRLLWSARFEPLTREQFESHWQAIRRIDVRALEKDPRPDSNVYALYADVSFDASRLPPDHELALDPLRQVVLLIMEDSGSWRLAKADRSVKEWIIKKTNGSAPKTPAGPDDKPPPSA